MTSQILFASDFGPIQPGLLPTGVHVDDVDVGMAGHLVDPLAFFTTDYLRPYPTKATLWEGMQRPVTVTKVARLRAGFITAIDVRDELTGSIVHCTRTPAAAREKLVRHALPPGCSVTAYAMTDRFFTSTPSYPAEVIGFVSSADETHGFALAARTPDVDHLAWERVLANHRGTPRSRRRSRYTNTRIGVHRALRLGKHTTAIASAESPR